MFEEYTEEYFMEQAREMGRQLKVDTRQGSVYMDAVSGHCIRTAKFYSDLDSMFNMLFIDTCTGDVLDEKASEKQVFRREATPAYYNVVFEGVGATDMIGDRFMANGYFFTLVSYDGGYYLRSDSDGSEVNFLLSGQILVPVRNITNLVSAKLGELYIAGTDRESDDNLRERYKAAVQGPAENGNTQQYKSWCEEFDGVGRAIMTPLAYGPNTVKALIISSDGAVPTDALINEIQEVIDPESKGLGEGKAFIGCQFYAVSVVETIINISFNVELIRSITYESTLEIVKLSLRDYLKKIALETDDQNMMTVQYVKVVSLLANIPAIKDFSNLLINGIAKNFYIPDDHVAVLGEVLMNVGV